MSAEHPKELKAILALLPSGWKLVRFRTWSMGWVADLKFKNLSFRLVSDRCYIDVSTLKDDKMKTIEPPPEQRLQISPKQICCLLKRGVQDWTT